MMLDVSLHHGFGAFTLDATFTAPAGVTALFGRSGSGKTTIVNAIAGLLQPDRGRVILSGTTLLDTKRRIYLPAHRRDIGYVFQDARLFPHLSVRANLDYGRRAKRLPPDPAAFDAITDLLGFTDLIDRRPGALSGGERQRVALGRALLARPKLLLMDEPLSALDAPRKAEILPYLERLRDTQRIPILYVSHAISEVARLATTLVIVDAGQVVRTGPAADILSDPDAVPLLGVRDAGSVLKGRVARHHADGLTELTCATGPLLVPRFDAALGTTVRVRVGASDVILSQGTPTGLSALNALPVTVRAIRRGAQGGAVIQLSWGSDTLLARISARALDRMSIKPGQDLTALLEAVSVAQSDIGTGQNHSV